MGCRIIQQEAHHGLTDGSPPTPGNTDDGSDRRRDPRFIRTGGEDERPVRPGAPAPAGHNEQDAADGGEDWRGLEGLARVLCRGGAAVHLCVAVLSLKTEKGEGREGRENGEETSHITQHTDIYTVPTTRFLLAGSPPF